MDQPADAKSEVNDTSETNCLPNGHSEDVQRNFRRRHYDPHYQQRQQPAPSQVKKPASHSHYQRDYYFYSRNYPRRGYNNSRNKQDRRDNNHDGESSGSKGVTSDNQVAQPSHEVNSTSQESDDVSHRGDASNFKDSVVGEKKPQQSHEQSQYKPRQNFNVNSRRYYHQNYNNPHHHRPHGSSRQTWTDASDTREVQLPRHSNGLNYNEREHFYRRIYQNRYVGRNRSRRPDEKDERKETTSKVKDDESTAENQATSVPEVCDQPTEQSTESTDARHDRGVNSRYRGKHMRNSYNARGSGHYVQRNNQRQFYPDRRGYRPRSSRHEQQQQNVSGTDGKVIQDEASNLKDENNFTRTDEDETTKSNQDDKHELQNDVDKVVCDNEEDLTDDDSTEKECPLCLEELDQVESQFYPCSSCKFQICLFCLHRLREECISGESEATTIHSCPGCRNAYPNWTDDEAVFMELSKKIKSKVHPNGSLANATHSQANGQNFSNKNDGGDKSVKSSVKSTNGNRYSNLTGISGEKSSPDSRDKRGQLKKSDEIDQPVTERTNEYRRQRNSNINRRRDNRTSEMNEKSSSDYSNSTRKVKKNLQIAPVDGEKRRTNIRINKTRGKSSNTSHDLMNNPDDAPLNLDNEPGNKKDLVDLLSNIGLDPRRVHFHRKEPENCQ